LPNGCPGLQSHQIFAQVCFAECRPARGTTLNPVTASIGAFRLLGLDLWAGVGTAGWGRDEGRSVCGRLNYEAARWALVGNFGGSTRMASGCSGDAARKAKRQQWSDASGLAKGDIDSAQGCLT
jgi:hypothetical protein